MNMPERKVIVFDAGGVNGIKNRLFSRVIVTEKHGLPTCYLYEKCMCSGYELMTPDLYYDLSEKPKQAIFIRNNVITSEAERLIKMGLRPAILMGFEFPLYAPRFYWNLERETRIYDHTFMPRAAESLVSARTKFHPWVSPQPYSSDDRVEANFNEKKFLTMISGNSRVHILKRAYATVMNAIKPLPTLVNRELYKDRLEAVKYFSKYDDFEFYGRGWDKPVRYTRGKYDPYIKKSWNGEVGDKLEILKQYKFSICFENAIYGGWITEKIIDCLFAGCVPIYWGAPDITEFIPESCFIDFRKFNNFGELNDFLRRMTSREYQNYIDAINEWIKTGFKVFSQEKYAEDMMSIFNSYF